MGLSGAFGIVISRAIARDVCEGPELMRFMAILMMVNGLAPIAGACSWRADSSLHVLARHFLCAVGCRYHPDHGDDGVQGNAEEDGPRAPFL